MRRAALALAACVVALLGAPAASGATHAPDPALDRFEELQQELDALTEDIEDLREPVAEFELFDECAYLIGVNERGRGRSPGLRFVARDGRASVRPALALGIRGFGLATYQFLAFPAEEPPSIECNEDAGEEETDD